MVTLKTSQSHYLPPSVYCTEYCVVHSDVPYILYWGKYIIFHQNQNMWLLFRNYRENVNSFWIHWWRRFRTFSYELLTCVSVLWERAIFTTRINRMYLLIQACGYHCAVASLPKLCHVQSKKYNYVCTLTFQIGAHFKVVNCRCSAIRV